MVSRTQARRCGLTDKAISARIRGHRWQRIYAGVYATFTGALPRAAQVWAAVLYAGPGAIISHLTAAELLGLVAGESTPIHVTVPATRAPRRVGGVVVHRSRRPVAAHPAYSPPLTRVEQTVLDLVDTSRSIDEASSWLCRAIGGRLTTAARLRTAIDQRSRLRWRRPIAEALSDVERGAHSVLELRYLRIVERAHELPRAERQRLVTGARGRRYDDVHYAGYSVTVELDGRAAHPETARWRDLRRDNATVAAGESVLRYGYADVSEQPCAVAGQVAGVLAAHGWTGRPRRCRRASCSVLP